MKPGEHKTVQARILAYAQEAGWSLVSRKEAGQRRGFEPQMAQMGTDAEPQKKICVNLRNLRLEILLIMGWPLHTSIDSPLEI